VAGDRLAEGDPARRTETPADTPDSPVAPRANKPMTAASPVTMIDGQLICPVCGEACLRQGKIEVFWRRQEDARSQARLVTPAPVFGDLYEGDELEVRPGQPHRDPSPRRHGLLIHFECECCGDLYLNGKGDLAGNGWVLAIWQHKGATYVEWQLSRVPKEIPA